MAMTCLPARPPAYPVQGTRCGPRRWRFIVYPQRGSCNCCARVSDLPTGKAMNDMTVGVGEARKRWRWTGLDLEPHTPHEVPGPSDEPYRTVLDGVLLYSMDGSEIDLILGRGRAVFPSYECDYDGGETRYTPDLQYGYGFVLSEGLSKRPGPKPNERTTLVWGAAANKRLHQYSASARQDKARQGPRLRVRKELELEQKKKQGRRKEGGAGNAAGKVNLNDGAMMASGGLERFVFLKLPSLPFFSLWSGPDRQTGFLVIMHQALLRQSYEVISKQRKPANQPAWALFHFHPSTIDWARNADLGEKAVQIRCADSDSDSDADSDSDSDSDGRDTGEAATDRKRIAFIQYDLNISRGMKRTPLEGVEALE
ncbi:hypothetical protein BJV77DRAFT_959965 [Russula vinacea]|nr:hypothetical protein BJV77DRAFT_959965 [Russula vinacea]